MTEIKLPAKSRFAIPKFSFRKKSTSRLLHMGAWIIPLFASLGLAAGMDLKLEVAASQAPEEVSAAVGEVLAPQVLRIAAGEEVQAEFWLRQEIPLQESSSGASLGITFTGLSEGLLIGVVRFAREWSDYRGRPIPAGIYTLRYALQPEDGNHLGASIYRDYLLLIPAAVDGDPEADFSFRKLINASRKASRTNHPAILSLFPIYDEVATPALVKNEVDQWTLAVSVDSTIIGLVVRGRGEG